MHSEFTCKITDKKKFCSLLHEDRLLARNESMIQNETMVQNETHAGKEESEKKLRRVHKSN